MPLSKTLLPRTLSATTTMSSFDSEVSFMDKHRFIEKTSWLRPYTRWATRFSLNSPRWLPAMLRNAPLKLSTLVLRGYHRVLR